MIEPKILREDPERIRDNLEKRNIPDFPLENLLSSDKLRRGLITTNQKLKEERNRISADIAESRGKNQDSSHLIEQMRQVSQKIADTDAEIERHQNTVTTLLSRLPNFLDNEVPIGKDNAANKEMARWGAIAEDIQTPDHVEISQIFDLIDIERAAKTSGARFYFLKRDLARLNYALISLALDFLRAKGFVLAQPPYMLKRSAIGGAVILSDFEEVIYKIEDEDLYLIGTSEHALASMHMQEIFSLTDLPLRYAGVSPCFRKEAGAHGKDTKGIFRVHQFEKVEQFVYCEPSHSDDEHKKLLQNSEDFLKLLELPYRVVILSSGDMGKVASKTYDVEAWMPSQRKYRELISCSNCTDFQSRALGIKYRPKPHEESQFLHTLNSTLVATERTIVVMIENYYDPNEKRIKLPKAVWPYMNGLEDIRPPAK